MQQFEKDLTELLAHRRDEMREKYNRVLPTGELLFNRFEKASYIDMGEGSSIYDASVVMGNVTFGKNVWVGPYTLIEGVHGKVSIGDFVSINAGVMIFSHDSTKHYLSGGIDDYKKGDVFIDSCTVIGSMSIILCGVSVGAHSLVSANSLVTKDVPPYSIAAGNPAKIIGKVLQDESGHVSLEYF